MVKVHEKTPPAARGFLAKVASPPLDPRLQLISPLVPWGEISRVNFYEINQDLFVKLFKSLAPGRAAGGIFNRTASGGKVCHLESWFANAH